MKKSILILTIVLVLLLSSCNIGDTVIEEEEPIYTELLSGNHLNDDSWGSISALEESQFSIEDMLLYAIQDEYSAHTEYEYIMSTFDVEEPFSNIIIAEETHIRMLLPLFEAYEIEVPVDTSTEHIIELTTLVSTFETGVAAEILNISMYDLFLTQNLPEDIRDVFTELRDASIKHLAAFEKNVLENS